MCCYHYESEEQQRALQQHHPAFLMCSMIAGEICVILRFVNAVLAAQPLQELQLMLGIIT